MRYIKTFEGFFSKIDKKISDLSKKSDRNLIPADFHSEEDMILTRLGFQKSNLWKNFFFYKSETTDIYISITKYWDEIDPGAWLSWPGTSSPKAEKLFKITIKKDGNITNKTTDDIKKVESIIIKLIPKVEQDIRKYNL
jgi:hypothetical protein